MFCIEDIFNELTISGGILTWDHTWVSDKLLPLNFKINLFGVIYISAIQFQYFLMLYSGVTPKRYKTTFLNTYHINWIACTNKLVV